MRKVMVLFIVISAIIATMVAFTILDNTLVQEIIKPQSASSAVTSSAFSMKGYENAHILVNFTPDATDATTTVNIYTAETETGTFTIVGTETEYNVTSDFIEYELDRDISEPWFKVKVSPDTSSTPTIFGVLGVFYGAEQAPF